MEEKEKVKMEKVSCFSTTKKKYLEGNIHKKGNIIHLPNMFQVFQLVSNQTTHLVEKNPKKYNI